MRVFFYKDNELQVADTINTPIFISCLPCEKEVFNNADDSIDSFCVYNVDITEEDFEKFVKSVYILSEKLNAEVENEIKISED